MAKIRLQKNKLNTIPQAISLRSKISKLSDIRQRKQDEYESDKNKKEEDAYNERYKNATIHSLYDIENILQYLMSRTDIEIEKNYDGYIIKLTLNAQKQNYIYIQMVISSEYVELNTEGNNQYNRTMIFNDLLYSKYNKELEEKYFYYINLNTKKTIDIINKITKIDRKNKISKLMDE